jgi:hypothetical protein
MMADRANNTFLRFIIPVLTLADGVIHLLLDFILFRGVLIGSPFPAGAARLRGATPRPGLPPGPRFQMPLPLNEMFLLNFIGAVVLVLLFLASQRWSQTRRALLAVVMIGYEALTFTAWWLSGRPNPMNLGYLSKGIEIVVVIALVVHLLNVLRVGNLADRTVTTGV